jgi:ATP-dependent DNA ligase
VEEGHRGGKFYFVESIKNGFVPATRARVYDAIKHDEVEQCPFVNLPEKKGAHRMDLEKTKTVRWTRPNKAFEIAFNERTSQGHLRHSRFLRLRDAGDVRSKESRPCS